MPDPFLTPEEKNYLEELVGEGKKFATVDDLAKGKFHSDAHIAVLESELAQLKAQAANATNVETLLTEIRKLKEPGNDDGQPKVTEPINSPQIDVEEKVLEIINKTDAERRAKANYAETVAKMNEVWGADASKELQKVAGSLGMTVEALRDEATKNPAVFYRLTGLNADRTAPSGTTVPTSTVRLNSTDTNVRNWSYYQRIKKENPSAYKSTQVQVQLNRDAIKLGEAFFA